MQADPVQQLLSRILDCARGAEDAMWNQGAAEQLAGIVGVIELADELRGHLAKALDRFEPLTTNREDAAVAAGFEAVPGAYWRDQGWGVQVLVAGNAGDRVPADCKPLFRQADR